MDRAEAYVGMPDSSLPTALPRGWTVVRDGDPLTVAGPELDLKVTFLCRPLADSIEDLLRAAWREIEPDFDIAVRQ